MFRKKELPPQQSIWVAQSEIVATGTLPFFQKLDEVFASFSFGDRVREICAPYYSSEEWKGGRPGIDPEVYFKMLLVGFFENIPSERGIASRCADSLSIRHFLHYDLTEATPHHSSFTRIRQRLPEEMYQKAFGLILEALKKHKLLKGKRVGMDASTMEANASLESLKHRLTGDSYLDYVRKLAAEAGVDTSDDAAVRRFDKNRKGRKTSNDEWHNPHDPDAKVGRTKRGTTRMIYKPEHVVDLDTGAILDADVRPGDEGDTEDLAERVFAAERRLNEALGLPIETRTIEVAAKDKGYYKVEELVKLQQAGIRTVISDPISNRRIDKLNSNERAAVRGAKRATEAKYGKELTRKRGELVERSFEHTLDNGGARQTPLRGRINIRKRYLIQAMGTNLSLLMRKLFGKGTPKQTVAAGGRNELIGFLRLIANEFTLRCCQSHFDRLRRQISYFGDQLSPTPWNRLVRA